MPENKQGDRLRSYGSGGGEARCRWLGLRFMEEREEEKVKILFWKEKQ